MEDSKTETTKGIKKNIDYFMKAKNWWGSLVFILVISPETNFVIADFW